MCQRKLHKLINLDTETVDAREGACAAHLLRAIAGSEPTHGAPFVAGMNTLQRGAFIVAVPSECPHLAGAAAPR